MKASGTDESRVVPVRDLCDGVVVHPEETLAGLDFGRVYRGFLEEYRIRAIPRLDSEEHPPIYISSFRNEKALSDTFGALIKLNSPHGDRFMDTVAEARKFLDGTYPDLEKGRGTVTWNEIIVNTQKPDDPGGSAKAADELYANLSVFSYWVGSHEKGRLSNLSMVALHACRGEKQMARKMEESLAEESKEKKISAALISMALFSSLTCLGISGGVCLGLGVLGTYLGFRSSSR